MGWIKLWRELKDKPIWKQSTPEQCKVLVTILMMVNYKSEEWEWKGKKFMVEAGQMITSLDSIQKQCKKGVSIRNVRTALVRFENLGFLTNESTKQGRLISILNWHSYQSTDKETDKAPDNQLTNDRQTTDKRLTPIKEVKKDKNDKNGKKERKKTIAFDQSKFDAFKEAYPKAPSGRTSWTETEERWRANLKAGVDPDDMLRGAENYARSGEEPQYIKGAQVFLGQKKKWWSEYQTAPETQPIRTTSTVFDKSMAAGRQLIEEKGEE